MTMHAERGVSLIESLMAFLVLSLGVLGTAQIHQHLQRSADAARQRTEAVRLAQEDMERLRGFAWLESAPTAHSYDDVDSGAFDVDATTGYRSNARYRIDRLIAVSEVGKLKTATLTVSWADRQGQAQRVFLQSAIAGTPPVMSGALALTTGLHGMHRVHGRSPHIPAHARDLGNGKSALSVRDGGAAWIFNNVSGAISARCASVPGPQASATSESGDRSACAPLQALLLSGWIRFSTPHSTPLALTVAVAVDASAHASECITEVQGDVLAYHCAVPSSGKWSGRSDLVPHGWTVGREPGQYKVCRYSADADGSGAVDANAEHPERYENVDTPLKQQNFLVVRGDQTCPSPGTEQHQP